MCGIVGFVDHTSFIDGKKILKRMLDIQAYRGPNDNGIYQEDALGVYFGHNRLSIQDLSSLGHQPFISDCGNYVITYNGEVYNFKSIRRKLIDLGYTFVSDSDTEVILYSYKEWGIKCLEYFIGMFSFALLDKIKNKLFLIRDRAGVKPLYYYSNNNTFIFSSELKSLHEHPFFEKCLNDIAMPYYFQFGYIPAPYSIFKDTYKLLPGHYLEYDLSTKSYNIINYWDSTKYYLQEKFLYSEKKIISDVENLLTDAVNLRMVADVPIGVFLSGGFDSSLVTALLAKSGTEINTFTIGFENKAFNEAEHAKAIARFFKTNHTEYYMRDKDMYDLVDTLPFVYDEPFADISSLPTMIVANLAKKDVTVVLSADGGDEAFCGYSKYFFLKKIKNISSGKIQKILLNYSMHIINDKNIEYINGLLPKNLKQTNIKNKLYKFKAALKASSESEMFINASSITNPDHIKKLIRNTIQINFKNTGFDDFEKLKHVDFLDQMMAIDYKTFMVDDVLTKVDRATMQCSIEGREPLIDHRLIEYLARVPVAIKYKNNEGKYILRQILYKHIPKTLIDKPKSGFVLPLSEWLQGDLKYLVDKYLNEKKLDRNIYNVEEVLKLKKEFFTGKEVNVNTIWSIIVFEMWKERWLD